MPWWTAPVDRLQLRLGSFQSVDRAVDRFHETDDRAVERSAFVHLVHTGRPGGRPAACCMRRFSLLCLSISVLSSSISSISSLPTIHHFGEDFSNLSQSPTNSSLSPGEIDTRSRLERSGRNRHTISAKSTHDLDLEPVAQLSTGMHHTCLPYTSP